jgi:subtilase family serine protease
MNARSLLALLCALALLLALAPAALAAPPPDGPQRPQERVCADTGPDTAHCHAIKLKGKDGAPDATSGPTGYTPADLQTAYSLSGLNAGNGTTVAIVDAFDNPNVESDLAVYRNTFGLAPCTTANGCFRKSDQRGGKNYPAGDTGWGAEIALDVDMVSAICPSCNILLVEADNNSFTNLAAAVNYAATVSGVTAISNSYGGNEFFGETSYESPYNHPNIAVTVSAGDSGYGAEFPAASRYVVAVGGTHLVLNANGTRKSETVWSGAGSGCSRYITKPSWQTDPGCARRTVGDIAAVADPATGVAVYDSYGSSGGLNWYVYGGTSVASPIIASVFALAGQVSGSAAATLYQHSSAFYDVTSGSNGNCGHKPQTRYLCTGVSGYDGPTGLGTPIGVTGFR